MQCETEQLLGTIAECIAGELEKELSHNMIIKQPSIENCHHTIIIERPYDYFNPVRVLIRNDSIRVYCKHYNYGVTLSYCDPDLSRRLISFVKSVLNRRFSMATGTAVHKSRWGYYPCAYEAYLTLKEEHKAALEALRLGLRYQRWLNKQPQNRYTPAPLEAKVDRDGYADVLRRYRLARYPKATLEEVEPL